MDTSLDEFYNKYHVNLVILFVIIITIYIGIFTLFNSFTFNTPAARPWIMLIEFFMWGLFIVIVYMNVKYFSNYDLNFNDLLFRLFGTKRAEMEIHVHNPRFDISGNRNRQDASGNRTKDSKNTTVPIKTSCSMDASATPTPTRNIMERTKAKKDISNCNVADEDGEVFHIPRNMYAYDEASEVCKMFDARLASYDEVEDAYKNGANWCSYGWSSDQLALFPIQKTMYNELKQIPGHEHDCGRTGVNGGYMENKSLKFGVNCYGKKPYAGDDDLEYMNRLNYSDIYPEIERKKKAKKEKINKILVAPFNKEKWNEL
jgi:hypothetical protein